MRLTLRTLLAYRDGVLDAVHVSELKKKFEESATAQSISQKIEAGIRNRKLIPLPIDAKGFGVDPNDVATFLDGTMPLDRLPEMERRCLESNSLLAEAAASHEILSRALRVNSPVSMELLDRLFLIGNTASKSLVAQPSTGAKAHSVSDGANMESVRVEEPILKDANGHTHRIDSHHGSPNAPYMRRLKDQSEQVSDAIRRDPVESPDSSADRTRPVDHALSGSLRRNSGVIEDLVDTGIELDNQLGSQIPEYLLGGDKKRFSDILTITILLTLFLFSVWMAMGPIDQIQGLLVAQNQTSLKKPEPINKSASADPFRSPLSMELETEKKAESEVPLEQPLNGVPDLENESREDSTIRSPVNRDTPADPSDQSIRTPPTSDSELSPLAGTSEPIGIAGQPPTTNWIWPSAGTQDDIRFLFVKDKNQRQWSMRANSSQIVIPTSDRIAIVAPTQCELTTSSTATSSTATSSTAQGSDFRWLISGDTNVERIATSEQTPRFRLSTRFAKILPLDKSRSLELDFDSGILELHFLSSQSEACIQTRTKRSHTASAVPDALMGLGEARIAAVGGELELHWKPRDLLQSSSSDPTSTTILNVSMREAAAIDVVLSPFHEAVITSPNDSGANFFTLQTQPSEFPWWVEELDIGNRSGLTPMQQALLASPDDWLDTLERFAKSEDLEAALEGLRAQIQLGKYELLFGSDGIFRRTELKPELGNLLDYLLTQLRNSEDVAEFQTQMKELVGERDVAVMELLIPKTKMELESGADKQLVDYLSDSMIDVRALAIMQLEMITGVTHGYQATNPSAESLLAWKRSLAKKQIRWKETTPPEMPETSQ